MRTIKGFKYGYEGLNENSSFDLLTPTTVSRIHGFGGSAIGTSRGPQNVSIMVDTLVRENVSILFTIGGDGTLRGAEAITTEIKMRKLLISIVGIPKTIDNDIPLMERTFGFSTAVSRAVEAIKSAHCEAHSHRNGISIVKLMGRDSGFVAASAAIASGEVNLCLIPECEFDLNCVTDYIRSRLAIRDHCLIVVAEGAGQHLFQADDSPKDKSGNTRFIDIGIELKRELSERLKDLNITLKYIDPSYIIRSAPATSADEEFCVSLAQNAAHTALSGKTNLTVGYVLNQFCLIPLNKLQGRKHIDITGPLFASLVQSVGQPPCMTCKE